MKTSVLLYLCLVFLLLRDVCQSAENNIMSKNAVEDKYTVSVSTGMKPSLKIMREHNPNYKRKVQISPTGRAMWYDAGFQPKIEIEYKIILSTGMRTALKEYDPEFKIWKMQDFNSMLRMGFYSFKPDRPGRHFLAYQTPSAVIGDFNGDNIPDIVLLGHDKIREKVIVILSKNSKYHIIELIKYPLTYSALEPGYKISGGNVEAYLRLISPGKIKAAPAYDRPELDIKTDAFEFGMFERASDLYYYSDGKFIKYALSSY